jgi:dGTPase
MLVKLNKFITLMKSNLVYNSQSNRYLAPYASFAKKSRGRLYKESKVVDRTEFQRDRDRIIHSAAFRRLESKTQVFLYNEGDHFRTRLTHSLEVSQLARSVARTLKLDDDLCEAIALAHDLGHTPFGHAGEDALEECMKNDGGFDHNAQTIRTLTKLERNHAKFDGLNLTWECLEGLAKHNGPVKNPPRALKEFNRQFDLELHTYASLEAQVAAICDDVAYNAHDIEDGIKAGLFDLKELHTLPLLGEILQKTSDKYPDMEEQRIIHENKSTFTKAMIKDLLAQTNKNILEFNIKTVDDVRNANMQIVSFSPLFDADVKAIKKFLRDNMYKHYKVNLMTSKAKRVVKALFEYYIENPASLPKDWRERKNEINNIVINVADFIAGMTDRYAFEQYKKIFDVNYTNL